MTRQSDVQESMKNISSRVEKAVEVRKYDEKAVQERMRKLHADILQKKLAEKKRMDELAQIPVEEADVALLMQELGCDRMAAEQRLREKKGDLVAVLRDVAGLPKARAATASV
ncbi:hypothetical protein C3747_35g495c [Trypanosoma cruzi]|uniref:Nascent polypeptide-associated complex subunit alpha-like UBA domain-containing protein n=2 Tax=Trypanosoma cruzi TaxID=5693 RepID=Q4DHW9_TRYCC|nr:hypothetical protein, conserved [Trypanosoma cruzi]XP_818051.1 hypothetical protein, conserved [Trypanosoma cruzi]PBJ69203.1 hypothetical protein BCY84_20300 [Trypanosoma cruzi cruzi]EAN92133.1 hypothetical protein, conserved [Trypanosoma cruzi]EAN96200.1 hypothetical protein, conserved [Trypanosoma cruzi]KAF8279272.1 hypothetical protein TcYC6_0018830 [Trypanosoma cruzi]KAF8290206.1 hypothetical protein TcBrA4_0133790 [Trypanosoma cruzi]|eukprot:XP_813984.1 hypothetical protein [Trypanosoma cruzi strain CL Brener]